MINQIGIWGIILFLLINFLAPAANLFTAKDLSLKTVMIQIIMLLSSLTFISYFFVSQKTFLDISLTSSIIIIVCSILNGLVNKDFHLSHHLVRIIIVIILFTLATLPIQY